MSSSSSWTPVLPRAQPLSVFLGHRHGGAGWEVVGDRPSIPLEQQQEQKNREEQKEQKKKGPSGTSPMCPSHCKDQQQPGFP